MTTKHITVVIRIVGIIGEQHIVVMTVVRLKAGRRFIAHNPGLQRFVLFSQVFVSFHRVVFCVAARRLILEVIKLQKEIFLQSSVNNRLVIRSETTKEIIGE